MTHRTDNGVFLYGMRVRTVVVGALLLLATVGSASAAETVLAATDCFITRSGSSANLSFPAGTFTRGGDTSLAFGPTPVTLSSDPLPQNTCQCGSQVNVNWSTPHSDSFATHVTEQKGQTINKPYDTCVRRNSAAVLSVVGTPVAVPVELLKLNLKGTITLPMSAGLPCTYEVRVREDGTQSLGSMSLTATQANFRLGTISLTSLPIGYRLEFTPLTGLCDPEPNQTGLSHTFGPPTSGTYSLPSSVPSMNVWGMTVLLALLLIGMTFMLWRRMRVANTAS